jgi:hypothetical protein
MIRLWRPALAGLCFFCAATSALAQEAPQPPSDPLAGAQLLDTTALDAEVVAPNSLTVGQSNQTVTATNSGNTITADNVETGDVVLGANAFSGFSGIGNFVMNTGNNNNLQGTVSVIVIVPPQ